jgi:trehalose/maltose hydrolase-like predicted phosphorylase
MVNRHIQDVGSAKGVYRFEWLDDAGRVVKAKEYHNVVTQNFFTGVFAALNGTTHDIIATHIATGTGTTAALRSDTALVAEVFRKAVSSKVVTATKFTAKLLLGSAESNVVIREVGVFAGSSMLSRCNVNIEKTASLQLLITYTLTME